VFDNAGGDSRILAKPCRTHKSSFVSLGNRPPMGVYFVVFTHKNTSIHDVSCSTGNPGESRAVFTLTTICSNPFASSGFAMVFSSLNLV
jgi:hypothetical protein